MNKKGFTLIETIIYIAIIGGIVATFVSFSLSISDSRNKTFVIQEVNANSRLALDLITQKIQASTGVNIGNSTFGSDPGVLELSMADSGLNPTIINLDQDDGVLQIKEGASDPVAIVTDEVKITNLVFTNLTSSSARENIKVEMTFEYNNSNSDVEFNYSRDIRTSVSVRQ
jgi:type II secretory pathway pseudopilin PulG